VDVVPGKYFYSIAEAAELLSRGRTKVYEAIATGELRTVKPDRRRLVPADALHEYAEKLAARGSVR
jgi:excisionase family DNA binding protein